LATQDADADLQREFTAIAERFSNTKADIIREFAARDGTPVDLDGYYYPDPARCVQAMRPSATFNALIAEISNIHT